MTRCKGLILSALVLWAIAGAGIEKTTIRITVLDSGTNSVALSDSNVPKNCSPINYDAYCHGSKTTEVTNSLTVQEGSREPFRVSCTVDAKWSRCVPLQKGISFDARREKNGLSIYYLDEKGKLRKQLYTYVSVAEGRGSSSENSPTAEVAPVPVQPEGQVKCRFASTPSGAEIQVDGKYVGSSPSLLSLATGKHRVALSMPGFAEWERELTVEAGSELTVNAVLEKSQ